MFTFGKFSEEALTIYQPAVIEILLGNKKKKIEEGTLVLSRHKVCVYLSVCLFECVCVCVFIHLLT